MTIYYKRSDIELLLHAGAIQSVEIFAGDDGLCVRVNAKNGSGLLLNERSQIRIFAKIDTAAKYLHEIGISKILLELQHWTPGRT